MPDTDTTLTDAERTCEFYDQPGQDCVTAGPQVVAGEGLCGPCAVHYLAARARKGEEAVAAVLARMEDPTHARCLRINCSICVGNDFAAQIRAALAAGGQEVRRGE